jgi:hypothetical protein
MRNHNELEIHIFDPGSISIPPREDSWGLPIYVQPVQYLRNRKIWKDEREADVFFGSGGGFSEGGPAEKVSIEVTYDITRARAAIALARTL